MSKHGWDLILAGGGLSNGLIAWHPLGDFLYSTQS